MNNLIRQIRAYANMSQDQFANLLGTTPVSINRWENGKTFPNLLAQKTYIIFVRNTIFLQLTL